MEEPETRVWPLPGDLCTVRNPKRLCSGVKEEETGWWWADGETGSMDARTWLESGAPAIVVSSYTFPWYTTGKKDDTVGRPLVYVITPQAIGWDDYGNYDVEVRPDE